MIKIRWFNLISDLFSGITNVATKALSLIGLILILLGYTSGLIQFPGSSLKGFEKIVVQHSHADDHHHHSHEAMEDSDDHEQIPDGEDLNHHEHTHTHIICSGSFPIHSVPVFSSFEGIQISTHLYISSKIDAPPIDPHVGSIFRPPIG